MFQILVCITLLLGIGSSMAQPGPVTKPLPLPFVSVPPAWPTLALNANKAPSCVFWTPPVTGATPEYFCAVIVADPSRDTDTTLCPSGVPKCAAGALRAVRVNPATGAITVGAAGPALSIILGQDLDSVTCTIIPPGFGFPTTTTVQCLIGSVERVGWDGTKWWSQTYGLDHTGIQGPPAAHPVTSNLSCVPWVGAPSTTCFGLETTYQSGQPSAYIPEQWTRDSSNVDFAQAPTNSSGSDLNPFGSPDPNQGPLVCTATAPGMFECIARSSLRLFKWTASGATNGQSVAWTTGPGGTLPPAQFVNGGVGTGQACETFPSASTSAPARIVCFFGDGGLASGPMGLFSAPDDMSSPVRLVMGESFPLKATPSCIGWALGKIECFFPDKIVDPNGSSSAAANAMIFHVLSYGEDVRTMLAEFVSPPSGKSPGFWQENLGVAAPTMELDFVGGSGPIHFPDVVNNPKTLTSFACFKGPPFQSLCVAGLIDSKFMGSPTTAQLGTYRASRRLVYKLVGNPNGVEPQAPTPIVVLPVPEGGLPKPVR